MDKKYEVMIEGMASDVVFELQASALRCAWNSTAIPVEFWEQIVSDAVKEVVKDILQDMRASQNSSINDRGFWKSVAFWRTKNKEVEMDLGGY